MEAEDIINKYNMQPLPEEGGWYNETYRAGEIIAKDALDCRYGQERCHSTAILYLLTPETCSKMHRVKSDEIFCYHLGGSAQMLWLNEDGNSESFIIGADINNGEKLQIVVPKGIWQGMRLLEGRKWILLSCIVAPGFEFQDYEHGDREKLVTQYPKQTDEIRKLT